MTSTAAALPAARWTPRVGTALVGLVTLFMLMDAVMHLLVPPPVIDAFRRLEFPTGLAVSLGIVELVCVALYAVPRTAVLGAILLTGYLGGATAINLRVGDPAFETLFPVIVGVLAWGALYLREERVRALLPLGR
jgi:DoxX-like family